MSKPKKPIERWNAKDLAEHDRFICTTERQLTLRAVGEALALYPAEGDNYLIPWSIVKALRAGKMPEGWKE